MEAVPILLRRIAGLVSPDYMVDAPRPIRIGRQKLLKDGELERAVELAAVQAGTDGCILILLDADDECPAELGPGLLQRARTRRPDCAISVVLAKAEYEAWFLAAGDSIAGRRGIAGSVAPPPNPESIRDAASLAQLRDRARELRLRRAVWQARPEHRFHRVVVVDGGSWPADSARRKQERRRSSRRQGRRAPRGYPAIGASAIAGPVSPAGPVSRTRTDSTAAAKSEVHGDQGHDPAVDGGAIRSHGIVADRVVPFFS